MSLLVFIGVVGYFMFIFYGIFLISGLYVSIIDVVLLLVIIFFLVFFLKEEIWLNYWIGIILGVIGVFFIMILFKSVN